MRPFFLKAPIKDYIWGGKKLKTEYNKIIFPTRQQVMKETGATIAVSFLIGVLIALLDVIMKSGLGLIIK